MAKDFFTEKYDIIILKINKLEADYETKQSLINAIDDLLTMILDLNQALLEGYNKLKGEKDGK